MEEELWQLKHQSRVLQEFRVEIKGLWDDEAARSINLSLLIPHQEDDEDMVAGFTQQHHNLTECEVHRQVAIERAQTATELSQEFEGVIERVDEDVEVAIQFEQQYRSFHAESQGILPEVDSFLEQANVIGNGAPPYES